MNLITLYYITIFLFCQSFLQICAVFSVYLSIFYLLIEAARHSRAHFGDIKRTFLQFFLIRKSGIASAAKTRVVTSSADEKIFLESDPDSSLSLLCRHIGVKHLDTLNAVFDKRIYIVKLTVGV